MEASFHSEARRIDRGASAIFGGFVGRLGARITLLLLIGRSYGAEALGELAPHAAAAEALGAIGAYGLRRSLQFFLAEDEAAGRPPAGRIFDAIAVAAVATAAAGGLAWLGLRLAGNPIALSFGAVMCGAIGLALAEVCVSATRFRHVMRWDVLRTLTRPWTFLGLALAAAALREPWGWSHGEALIGAYLGSITATACVTAIGLSRVYRSELWAGPFATGAGMRDIIARGLSTAVVDVAAFLYRRIDVLVLALLVEPGIVGIYYMAQQIATIPEKIRYVYEPPLAPVLARLQREPANTDAGRHLRRISQKIWNLQLLLLPPLAVFAPDILGAFGPAFVAGASVLAILLVGELFEGTSGPAELALVFRRPHWAAGIGLGVVALEAAGVAVLTHSLGPTGAALGFVLAMISLGIARLVATRLASGASVVTVDYPISALAAGASIMVLLALSGPGFGMETRTVLGAATVATQAGILALAGILRPAPSSRTTS